MEDIENTSKITRGKEAISVEALIMIIEFIGMGYSLPASINFTENKGFLRCHEVTFYRLIKKYRLEEEYHDAYQTRKLILEERLLEETSNVKARIASEFSYTKISEGEFKKVPTKYIANSAGVQKLELKRKIIAGLNGITQKFRIVEGEKVKDQVSSLKSAIFKREIATTDAVNIMNVLDKEITLLEFDDVKKRLEETETRMRNLESRSR